eukprot:Nk52_evm6s514 gene=Nk52_evmTU6s514
MLNSCRSSLFSVCARRGVAMTSAPVSKLMMQRSVASPQAGVMSLLSRSCFQRTYASDIYYTKSNEWVKLDPSSSTATMGLSNYAQDGLGEVVYIELPEEGTSFEAGESIGQVESVKAASDVYSPIPGEVVEVNKTVEETPALINKSPEEDGWICKLKYDPSIVNEDYINSEEELMTPADYQVYLESETQ